MVVSIVLLAPAVADLPDALHRLRDGDVRWLALRPRARGAVLPRPRVLFRAVGLDERGRIGLRASTEITLAGHAATRLLASAGAGGIALTAWAMRRRAWTRATSPRA